MLWGMVVMWPASALIVGRASHAIGTSCEELVATTEEELVSFSFNHECEGGYFREEFF